MDKKNVRNYLRSNKKKQFNIDISAEENLDDEKSSFLFNLVSLEKGNVIDRKCRISSLSRNESTLEISFFKEKKKIQDSANLFQSPFHHDIVSYKNKKNFEIITKNSKHKNKIVNKNKNFSVHNLQDTRIKRNLKKNAKVDKTDNKIVEDYVEQCPIDWSEIENFDLIVEKTFKEGLKIDASIKKCIKTVNEKTDLNVSNKEIKPENINTELKIISNKTLPKFEEKNFDDDNEIVNIKHSRSGKTGENIKPNFNSEFSFSLQKEIPSFSSDIINSVKVKPKFGLITSTPNVSPTKFDHKVSYDHENLVNLSLKSLNQSFDCSVLESTKAKLQNLINKNHNNENLTALKTEKLNDTVFKTHVFKNIFDKDYLALIENSSLCQEKSNFSERRDLLLKSSNEYSKNKILSISLASDYSKVLFNSFSLNTSNFENSNKELNDIGSISNEEIFSSCRLQKVTCRKVPVSKLSIKYETNNIVNESDFKYVQNSHLQNEKFYCDDFSLLQKSFHEVNSFDVKQYSSCCFKSYCEFVSLAHNLSNGISVSSKTASKFSKVSSKDCIDISNEDGILENNPSIIVLTLCNQVTPVNFMDVITSEKLLCIEKIGEGLYGEVFCFTSEEKTVYKIVPIEGDIIINGEQQKSFQEIMPEMLISLELSVLLQSSKNVSPNFIQVNRISCVSGVYPEKLLQCWDEYAEIKGTENDRPDCFPPNQLYIIFEFAYGGVDLESVKLKNILEAKSIFQQVASALAVAEAAIEFEHRDLHWGNILIAPTMKKSINYVLQDNRFTLKTSGILVTIIDFTLSYLRKDGCTIFTNLSEDISLFNGEGDYQFDVYRLMKEHNGNNWDMFSPYSNVLWLHYLLEKLLRGKTYHNRKSQKSVRLQLQKWQNCILNYESAIDFVMNSDFLNVVQKEVN